MPTANITITVDYTAAELENMREIFANQDGTTTSNAAVVANIKAYLKNCLAQRYRDHMRNKQTAAIAASNLTLS